MNVIHYVQRLVVVGALGLAACGGDKKPTAGGLDEGGAGGADQRVGESGSADDSVGGGGGNVAAVGEAGGSGDDTGLAGAMGEGGSEGREAPADAGAAGQGGEGGDDGLEPPKTHAELCPQATPGVGVPEPVGDAQPERLHPFYQYLESPIAVPADFGLAYSAEEMEVVESHPDVQVHEIYTHSSDLFRKKPTADLPDWLDYEFDGSGTTGRHLVSVDPRGLQRGTYHVTLPLQRRTPIAYDYLDQDAPLDLVVRVRGLGFTVERFAVPHYVADSRNEPLLLTLAGGDVPWKITDAPDWLKIAKSEGDVLEHIELELTRDSFDQLAIGHHEARLCVENARGDAASIPVYALVERPRLRPLHTQRYLYNFASSELLVGSAHLAPMASQATVIGRNTKRKSKQPGPYRSPRVKARPVLVDGDEGVVSQVLQVSCLTPRRRSAFQT
ncbi:MAG TPA: hypothetical protein VJN18_19920 [Polyangiaceae bacterium]|nr:hypothetical protein [Polyangiaceae bacterium]